MSTRQSGGSYAKAFLDSLLVQRNGSSVNATPFSSSSSTTATANTTTSSASSSIATSIGAAPLLTAAFKPHKPSSLSSSASASASDDGDPGPDPPGYDAYLPSTLLSQVNDVDDLRHGTVVDDDDASSLATSSPLSSSFKAQQLSLQALSHHGTFSSSSSRRTSTSAPTPDFTADLLATLNDSHLDEEERIDKVRATLANALYAIEGVPSPSARIDHLVLDLMHRHREDVQPTGASFAANSTQSPVRRPASIRSFSTSRPWTPSRPSFSPASSLAGTPTDGTPSAFTQRPTSPHLGSSALASLTSAASPVWPSATANTAASPRPHPGVIGSGSPRASPKPWNRTLSNLSTTSLVSSNGGASGVASPMASLPPGVIGSSASRPASPSPFGSPKLNIAATEFKPRTASSSGGAPAPLTFTPTRPASNLIRRPSSNASSSSLALANKSHAGANDDDDDDEFSPFGTIKPAQQQPISFAGYTSYDPDAGWTAAPSFGASDTFAASWIDPAASAGFDPAQADPLGAEPTAPLTPFDMLYSILVTGTKAGSSEWSPEQVDEALVMHNYDVEKTLNAIWENDGKPLGDGTQSLLSGGASAPRLAPTLPAISSPRFAPSPLPATAGVKAGVNVMSREALGLGASRGQRPDLTRSGPSQLTPRYEAAASNSSGPAGANRVCRYYMAGECRRSDCRFSHDLDSRAVCRYWLKGHCAHNPCNFLHDYDALNQLATGIVSGLHVNDGSDQRQPASTPEANNAGGSARASNGSKDEFPELNATAKDASSKTSYAATLGGGTDVSKNRWATMVQKGSPVDAAIKAQSDAQAVISIHSKGAPIRSQPASSTQDSKPYGKNANAAPRPSARLPLRPSALLPTLLTGSSAAETYQTHRGDALSLAEQRNKLLVRASEAYRKGDVASAKKFSKEASSLNNQYENESRTAAHAIVKERMRELRSRLNDPNLSGSNASSQSNEAGARRLRGKLVGNGLGLCLGVVRPGALQGSQTSSITANLSVEERTECLLDLHGLLSKEAVELTEEFLLGLEAEGIQGLAYIAIGKAKHSSKETDKRRVKVGGFVKQFLSSYSYPFAESDGVLVVDHLSHS
ncbi:uncharacterized protein UMAG_04609 [Mycosarcoma maydis]|uniref:Uncharacterized protein n=1 Tax=Mycosarcoma maydis TaxID=5270 RepID=A0A0D1DT83_MYCMD|nr:uncharacterized protein UMAG_04609 [Ustilago maydis 521]KIS67514.1 hypothetical protein UMAG_04609 [Ustilago maydis 521]|eukprot:XP_011390907.1 hypothetical protein UMAG_04609 [Ustilago maydis 521]